VYKSQNLQQNLDLKVGGVTYTRDIKRIFSSHRNTQFPMYRLPDNRNLFTCVALLCRWQSKLLDE